MKAIVCVKQVLGSVNAGFHLSQLELGVLELSDGTAKLLALLDIGWPEKAAGHERR